MKSNKLSELRKSASILSIDEIDEVVVIDDEESVSTSEQVKEQVDENVGNEQVKEQEVSISISEVVQI